MTKFFLPQNFFSLHIIFLSFLIASEVVSGNFQRVIAPTTVRAVLGTNTYHAVWAINAAEVKKTLRLEWAARHFFCDFFLVEYYYATIHRNVHQID